MNVLTGILVLSCISHSPIIKTSLPDSSSEAKCLSCPERESAFDELDCSFQCDDGSDQQVKMIRHHYEFMEQVFALVSVVEENPYEKASHPFTL